jgi:GLPGLI family protein
MKKLLCLLLLLSSISSFAQKILYKGIITYDRKENLHAQTGKFGGDNEWAVQMKKRLAKYKITRFEMLFNMNKSLYRKSKTQPENQGNTDMGFMGGDKEENITYKHTDSNIIITQMKVFEKNFLLQDSLPVYNWKITNEYKNICGYNCRKATAITMDSLYLIAFYTDAIYQSMGPLSTNGLPGAILGLVVPRFNTNYFATKVDAVTVLDEDIIPAAKGEKINSQSLSAKVKEATKSWGDGKYFMEILWATLL